MSSSEAFWWGCLGSLAGWAGLVALPYLLEVWRDQQRPLGRRFVQVLAGLAFVAGFVAMGGAVAIWMAADSPRFAMSVGFGWQAVPGVLAGSSRRRQSDARSTATSLDALPGDPPELGAG